MGASKNGERIILVTGATVMYHWFEEKGFHFNIEEVRREYPLTHTFDRWLEACWNTTAIAAS